MRIANPLIACVCLTLASVPRPGNAQPQVGWRLPESLVVICSLIGNQTTAGEDSPWVYEYQARIYQSAGATLADGPEQRAHKVRQLWSLMDKHMFCSNSGFEIQNGSILKYAVDQRFDSFINDVTRIWKVREVNKIDRSDGRTVLDYISDSRSEPGHSPAVLQKLGLYYGKFSAVGARHRVDIDGVDCRTGGRPPGTLPRRPECGW